MAKRLQYTEEAMTMAVNAVKSGDMTAYKAHKIFSVPRTTLLDKLMGRTPVPRIIGVATILTNEEENNLVKWIFHSARYGFPVTKEHLLDSVEILTKQLQRENNFTNGRPGRRWYKGFMNRHPELSVRISQNLTSSRAAVTKEKIINWFNEVSTCLEEDGALEILNYPDRVFNCDETALYINPKEDKVIVQRGQKAVYNFVNNDEKECLTTLITCSASGEIAPPMIMFNYQRIPKTIAQKIPDDWGVGRSESGWMTGESFFEYISNVFYNWLKNKKCQFPVILFLDGHKSHLTLELSTFCSEHQIILISLLANSTHILQPLDVAAFRPLKREYRRSIREWRIANDGAKLTRENFSVVLKMTLDAVAVHPEILQNGFRCCGLVPFNPNAIDYPKYFNKDPVTENQPKLDNEETIGEKSDIKLPMFLSFLEKQIKDKLNAFKNSGKIWAGPIEDKSLFLLWHSLKTQCDDNEAIEPLYNVENRITELPDPDIDKNKSQSNENNSSKSPNDTARPDEYSWSDDISFILKDREFLDDNIDITDLLDTSDISLEKPIVITVPSDVSLPPCGRDEHRNVPPKVISSTISCCVSNHNEENPVDPKGVLPTKSFEKSDEIQDSEKRKDDELLEDQNYNTKEVPNKINCNKIDKNKENVPPDFNIDQITPIKTQPFVINNNDSKEYTSPNILINVPTPFKKALFWPEEKAATSKKKNKEKIPSVATSKQWQEYYKNKENKKIEEQKAKEIRILERKKKQTEKQEILKQKQAERDLRNNKRQQVKEESESEKRIKKKKGNPAEETKNSDPNATLKNMDNTNNFAVGEFVAVTYQNQPYPGKIIDISFDLEENQTKYKVTHLEKKGLNWRWPEKEDILSYFIEDIIKKINEPETKNKRGLFNIEELSNFSH